jgi:hypothetical protein
MIKGKTIHRMDMDINSEDINYSVVRSQLYLLDDFMGEVLLQLDHSNGEVSGGVLQNASTLIIAHMLL